MKTVLWWGRFDPDYSRNRILRQCYANLGWQVVDFHPHLSTLGDLETLWRRLPAADLVHVPCFRQRDVAAAARYARRHGVPLLFDPLISAYDKQVYERRKVAAGSPQAGRILAREQRLFAAARVVLADTDEHARFFAETLQVDAGRLRVVYVGAEESLFMPQAGPAPRDSGKPIEALFYGSFIPLQGPETIIDAARCYAGPAVHWVLLGDGPLRAACQARAAGLTNVSFEDWLPYPQLPERIHRADVLLGVFGDTPKAQRVIPNKVFQSLACGKPLVTEAAPAYPSALHERAESGIAWVPPADALALAHVVATLAEDVDNLPRRGRAARASYEQFFSKDRVCGQLRAALATLG